MCWNVDFVTFGQSQASFFILLYIYSKGMKVASHLILTKTENEHISQNVKLLFFSLYPR